MHLPRLPSSIRIKRTEKDQRQRATDNARRRSSDDDQQLSEEVQLARRAIRDLEEQSGPSSTQWPETSSSPRRQSRSVVENLALRNREVQRAQRKEAKRRKRFNSTSSSGSSEPSSSRGSASGLAPPAITEPQGLDRVDEEPTPRSASTSGAEHLDPTSLAGQQSYFTSKQGHTLSQSSLELANRQRSSSTSAPKFYIPSDGISPFSGGPYPPTNAGEQGTSADTTADKPSRQLAPPLKQSKGRATISSFRLRLGSFGFGTSEVGRDADQDVEAQEEEHQRSGEHTPSTSSGSDMHEDEVVDYLDVVDPEIGTVTALQNVGNSIFFPPIPKLYSRRPTITLPSAGPRSDARPLLTGSHTVADASPSQERRGSRASELGGSLAPASTRQSMGTRRNTLSRMGSYVGLNIGRKEVPEVSEEEKRKHTAAWAQMDEEERNELDEHVRMLLTKKAKFKRLARGFWRYVKTPMGFIITLYAFLITFWGTAICLFLLRWIDVNNPSRQRYWIEICDQILCALFAAVGLGFAPFRAVDTYRMSYIAHYHFLTYKKRRQMNLPELKDKNELPRSKPRLGVSQMAKAMMNAAGFKGNQPTGDEETGSNTHDGAEGSQDTNVDMRENGYSDSSNDEPHKHKRHLLHKNKKKKKKPKTPPPARTDMDGAIPLGQLRRNASIASELPKEEEEVVVLTPKQQAKLEYQQRKFHESHTFYRYRETITHRPFELSIMMAVVILLDCHSCLQASLGGTTWGIYYKNRPTSVTATIITFSLSCNIVAGILISWGGNRTKKTEEVKRLLRIALEEEALAKIERRKRREQQQKEQEELDNARRDVERLACVHEAQEISRPTSPASAVMQRFKER